MPKPKKMPKSKKTISSSPTPQDGVTNGIVNRSPLKTRLLKASRLTKVFCPECGGSYMMGAPLQQEQDIHKKGCKGQK